jgi:hypothetical protein
MALVYILSDGGHNVSLIVECWVIDGTNKILRKKKGKGKGKGKGKKQALSVTGDLDLLHAGRCRGSTGVREMRVC